MGIILDKSVEVRSIALNNQCEQTPLVRESLLTKAVSAERAPAASSMAYGGVSKLMPESESLLFNVEEELESDQFPKIGVLGSGGGVDLDGGKSISTACSNGFVQGRTQNYKWTTIMSEKGDCCVQNDYIRSRAHSYRSKLRRYRCRQ